MVSITLSIPEKTREIMKEFPEINWSHLVRESINEKTKILKLKKEMFSELDKEKIFNDWAVKVIRKERSK